MTPSIYHAHARTGDNPPPLNNQDEIQLLYYWRILQRRRVVALCSLAAVVLLTVIFTLLATPEYQATATLQIERQSPDILTFKDVLNEDGAGYQDFYQTQYKILQSRAVLGIAAERIDLVNRPEYAGRRKSPLRRARGWLASIVSSAPATDQDPHVAALRLAVEFIEADLSIQPVRKSHLVKVGFLDRDPDLARDVANAVVAAYQQFSLEARYSTTSEASEFLTKQVVQLQSEIREKERLLQEYRVEKNLLAVYDDGRDISAQGLAELNAQYIAAKGRMALAEAKSWAVQEAPTASLPEVLSSPLIIQIRQDCAELERRHLQMSDRFHAGWPALRQLGEELALAYGQLEIETEAIASRIRSTYRAEYEKVAAEVAGLAREVDLQKTEVQQVNRESIEYESLRAEIDSQRTFLNDLVSRQSETEISDRLRDTQTSNIRLVDAAEKPERPLTPRKLRNLLGSLLVGSLFGIGMALFLDYLDYTIKDEKEVERLTGLPVLGRIPLFHPLKPVIEGLAAKFPDSVGLGSYLDPRSAFAEAYKTLRTSLLLASPDGPPRRIVVTSCEPGDGKSTVAANLAITLTQLGRRVLLLDADLRNPTIHRMLGLPNKVGLSNLLTGHTELDDILRDSAVPGLSIVTSGPIPPTPSELLGSPALQGVLDRAGEGGDFEHIIIDCPPSLQVTDSVILATRADATVFVTRTGKTSRESIAQGVARLRQARAHVVGVVMNAMQQEAEYYYGRYVARGEDDDEIEATVDLAGSDPSPRRRGRGA